VVDTHGETMRWLSREEAMHWTRTDLPEDDESGGMPDVGHVPSEFLTSYVAGTEEPGDTFKDMIPDCHCPRGSLGSDEPTDSPESPEDGPGKSAGDDVGNEGDMDMEAHVAAAGTDDAEEEEEEAEDAGT
jgi:hypothetical protein